jgi:hypothetical protein
MDSPHRPRRLSEIIEAQHPIRSSISSQSGLDPPKQLPSAGAGEVRVYLFLQTRVTNHRRNPFLALSDATPAHQSLTRTPMLRAVPSTTFTAASSSSFTFAITLRLCLAISYPPSL